MRIAVIFPRIGYHRDMPLPNYKRILKKKRISLFLLCTLLLTACGRNQPQDFEESDGFAESVSQESTAVQPTEESTAESEETVESTTEPMNNSIEEHLMDAKELPEDLIIPQDAAYCQLSYSPRLEAMGVDSRTYTFFDVHGNPTESIYYYEGKRDENGGTLTEYSYNEDGTIAEMSTHSILLDEHYRYTYNADGTIDRSYELRDGVEVSCTQYEYNSHGDVKREVFFQNGTAYTDFKYRNEYDDAGRLIRQSWGEDELATEMEYFYDAENRVIQEIVCSLYLETTLQRITYGYDEAGRKIELTWITNGYEVTSELWYGYVYF